MADINVVNSTKSNLSSPEKVQASVAVTYRFEPLSSKSSPQVRQASNLAQIFSAVASWLALSSILVAALVLQQNISRDRDSASQAIKRDEVSQQQAVKRDQVTASSRICEKFATDSFIVNLVADIRAPLRTIDANGKFVLKPPFPSSIDPSPLEQDNYKSKFRQWLQILDAIAVGLNEKVYDEGVMKACMKDVFASTKLFVSDAPDRFFSTSEYPEILTWANKLN